MPIPGIRGMEHVGLHGPRHQRGLRLLREDPGRRGTFHRGEGFQGRRRLDEEAPQCRSESCVIKEFRYVRCGNGTNLEVFQYEAPNQAQKPLLKNSDIGGHHLAFYVDDMDEAIAFLKKNGVKVLGEPTSYTDGPNLGLTWCYFMAPWGLQLEIVSSPNDTTFDKEAKKAGRTRLFHPGQAKETLI